jgi:hypothetical protein
VDGAPAVVDIRNGSGDPAVASELAALLATAGIRTGSVTSTDDTTSAVWYPDAQATQAEALATALGLATTGQTADVVTVVIGAGEADRPSTALLGC